MPNAAAFVGGGLLEGFGKGLAAQATLKGVAKRERALADLEHTRNLERDKTNLEGRRGLLTHQFELENARPPKLGAPIAGIGPDDKPGFFRFPESGGPGQRVEGVAPLPKANITPAQQASNAEIDAARKFWQDRVKQKYSGDPRAMMSEVFTLDPITKGLVPKDKALSDMWARARRRKVGDDPGFEPFVSQFIPGTQSLTPTDPPINATTDPVAGGPERLPSDLKARADSGEVFTEAELRKIFQTNPKAFAALRAYLEGR